MKVTGSVGLLVLLYFNQVLCCNLVHSGILDVEVLVKICWHLVHSWVWTREILINFP